jgi:hypothetical protein
MKILCLDRNRPLRPRTCKEEEKEERKERWFTTEQELCIIQQSFIETGVKVCQCVPLEICTFNTLKHNGNYMHHLI